MNATATFSRFPSPSNRTNRALPQAAPRHLHRERDFGVGYGNSSGYASSRSYVTASTQRLFRFA